MLRINDKTCAENLWKTRAFAALFAGTAVVLAAPAASSATMTNITVNASSPVFDSANVVGVPFDAAPGFPSGSIASNGTGKSDMYFTPDALFLRPVTLGEVQSISYWTKKGSTHTDSPPDWALVIYTEPYDGDVSTPTWYGDRIGSEPYFSINLVDPADAWNQWSTDFGQNRLRFYESTAGASGANFGTYNDSTWDEFVSGKALSGKPYTGHQVLNFSLQTGSNWASGFTGKLDGLRIQLTDGSVATANFESPAPPQDKDACKGNSWKSLTRGDGSVFKNQGDCVQFVNTGR